MTSEELLARIDGLLGDICEIFDHQYITDGASRDPSCSVKGCPDPDAYSRHPNDRMLKIRNKAARLRDQLSKDKGA